MKIKRFFSNDMRSVIRKVRDELGPDAVILSNNKVNGGVEIVAAVDYDESLFSEESQIGKQSTVNQQESDLAFSDNSKQHNIKDSLSDTNNAHNLKNEQISSSQTRTKKSSTAQRENSDILSNDANFTFYALDENNTSDTSIENSLHDVLPKDRQQPLKSGASSVWSQEPTLVSMQNEISTLRNLLEQQLSGLAWGDIARNRPLKAKLLRQLIELDFSPTLAEEISLAVSDQSSYEEVWQAALNYIAQNLPIADEDFSVSGGVVAFVGTTGIGKTTTIAKLAARYALRHGREKVALITTDSFRIGAQEQLRTYGRILGIPMRVVNNNDDLVTAANSYADKQFVLIDTAGMSQRDSRLQGQLNMLKECVPNVKTVLTLSATTHRLAVEEVINSYGKNGLHSCVITKADETTNLGGVLSTISQNKLPVAYICDGQKVPEDIHQARAHSLVNRTVLIARHANQPMEDELMELALNRMSSNVHA